MNLQSPGPRRKYDDLPLSTDQEIQTSTESFSKESSIVIGSKVLESPGLGMHPVTEPDCKSCLSRGRQIVTGALFRDV